MYLMFILAAVIDVLDPAIIVSTLAGVISILALAVFKLQTDQISTLKQLVDKLGSQNDELRDRLNKELKVDEDHSDILNRILVIVEGLRYTGGLARSRSPRHTE